MACRVKVALILGFYQSVHDYLHGNYQDSVGRRKLISLPRQRRADLQLIPGKFKSRLMQLLAGGAEDVLVVLALPHDARWMQSVIQATIEQARSRFPTAKVRLVTSSDTRATENVVEELVRFGVATQDTIPRSALEERLGQSRVLFVWPEGRTPPSVALRRRGFMESDIRDFFEELAIDPGRNSNLVRLLRNKAKEFEHLLYAGRGLRTLPREVKRRFKGVTEASDTTKVADLFARWLTRR